MLFSPEQRQSLGMEFFLVDDRFYLTERVVIAKSREPEKWSEAMWQMIQAKRLYNKALYDYKRHYKETQEYLDENRLKKQLQVEPIYRVLNTNVSGQVIKQLIQDWRSFFGLLRSENIDKKLKSRQRPPAYKRKGAFANPWYLATTAIQKALFKKQDDHPIRLSGTTIDIYSRCVTDLSQLKGVRLVPSRQLKVEIKNCRNQRKIEQRFLALADDLTQEFIQEGKSVTDVSFFDELARREHQFLKDFYQSDIIAEIVYSPYRDNVKSSLYREMFTVTKKSKDKNGKLVEKQIEQFNLKGDIGKVAVIDMNLRDMAVATSDGFFLFNLRPVKHKNQLWNDAVAKLQQKIDKVKKEEKVLSEKLKTFNKDLSEIEKIKKEKITRRLADYDRQISNLMNEKWRKTAHRNQYMSNFSHQLSRQLITLCKSFNIQTIIIGKNKNQKQGINLKRKTNREFVLVPFTQFIEKIQYKALKANINVILVEESYTSKTSYVDQEPLFSFKSRPSKAQLKTELQGRRLKRGVFKTRLGKRIHADINGCCNIGRKVIGEEMYQYIPSSMLASYQPNRVNVTLK